MTRVPIRDPVSIKNFGMVIERTPLDRGHGQGLSHRAMNKHPDKNTHNAADSEELERLRLRIRELEEILLKDSQTEVYLSVLHQTALSLMQHRNVDELMKLILKNAATLIGTSHGFVHLIDTSRNVMRVRVALGN
ncbi:MAG: hypothetical protein KDK34_11480, partial [Leptospiraceae bacterium]|nr:hypothetical protein [Leptospiraceae bacterium]